MELGEEGDYILAYQELVVGRGSGLLLCPSLTHVASVGR